MKRQPAFTLVETIAVIALFGLLAGMLGLVMAGILRGTKKSTVALKVRSEGAYALEQIISELKYAKSMLVCPTSPTNSVTFVKTDETQDTFSYVAAEKALYQGATRMTSDAIKINIVGCSGGVFDCDAVDTAATHVTVCFNADISGGNSIVDQASVNYRTQIWLRNVNP